MKAVIFGAGNIGKGFLGLELANSGYELFFVDVMKDVITSLHEKKQYTIEYLDVSHEQKTVHIAGAFHVSDKNNVLSALQGCDIIVTAVGPKNLESVACVIAEGLKDGKERVVIAAENVPNNSWFLRDAVKKYGDTKTVFPRCVVDRIAVFDEGMTKVERSFEWVIEDLGKNPSIKGVHYTSNLTPFLERKLLVLNGSHAVLGFLGYRAKIECPAVAMQQSSIRDVVVGVMREAAEAVAKEYSFTKDEMEKYQQSILERFENVLIPDKCDRLARDPVRKLRERLIPAALLAQKHNLSTVYLEQGIRAGLEYDNPADKESVDVQAALKVKGVGGFLKDYFSVPDSLAERILKTRIL